MTATRVELPNPGDSLTMLVTECHPATSGNFPGIEFFGMDGGRLVVVEIPTATTQRQLERLKLSSRQVVGKILTLSRSFKTAANGRPFWNIEVVGQGNGAPPASSSVPAPARAQEPPSEEPAWMTPANTSSTTVHPTMDDRAQVRLALQFVTYDKCFAHALSVAKRAGDLGFHVDPAQIAATLYINASRNG